MSKFLIIIALLCLLHSPACQQSNSNLLQKARQQVAISPVNLSNGGPHATTDGFLAILEIPQPSATLTALFKDRPSNEAIVFARPGDEPQQELLYYTLSYLLWPRQVGELVCGSNPATTGLISPVSDARAVKWLFYYRRQPPPGLASAARQIGPHLSIVQIREVRAWSFYCSPQG